MPRPRKYAPETARLEANRARRAAIAERGGRVVKIRLEPEHVAALSLLQTRYNLATVTDAVGRAIMVAAEQK